MKRLRWEAAKELLLAHRGKCEQCWKLAWELGWACFKLGELDVARRWLEQSVSLEPSSAVTHFGLGVVLHKLDDDAAEDELTRSLDIRDGTIARITLAYFYMKRKRYVEAEAVHVEGLRLRPCSRGRTLAYADFLSDLRRDDEADLMYEKARTLSATIPKKLGVELAAIDWSKLDTAFGFGDQRQGNGGTIAEEIVHLWAREELASAAVCRLWMALIYDEDYLSPAAIVALPFLVEALRTADTNEMRDALIGLFTGLAQNARCPSALERGKWVRELREALAELRPKIEELAEDDALRESAKQFLEETTSWSR